MVKTLSGTTVLVVLMSTVYPCDADKAEIYVGTQNGVIPLRRIHRDGVSPPVRWQSDRRDSDAAERAKWSEDAPERAQTVRPI
jgi:hypothetical protein